MPPPPLQHRGLLFILVLLHILLLHIVTAPATQPNQKLEPSSSPLFRQIFAAVLSPFLFLKPKHCAPPLLLLCSSSKSFVPFFFWPSLFLSPPPPSSSHATSVTLFCSLHLAHVTSRLFFFSYYHSALPFHTPPHLQFDTFVPRLETCISHHTPPLLCFPFRNPPEPRISINTTPAY